MKYAGAAAAVAAAVVGASAAKAVVFNLTYTGADFALSATLDATALGGGEGLVTDLVVGSTVTDSGGPEG